MIPVWEPRRLPELLAALGTAADFSPLPPPPPALLPRTMAGVAAAMGLELRPVTVRYPQLEAFLDGDGPVVVQCLDRPGLLALLRGGARPVLLRPEGGHLRLSREELLATLRAPLDRQAEAGLEELSPEGRQRVLRGLLGRWDIPGFHLLRPALNRPVTTLRAQLVPALRWVGLLALGQVCSVGAWWFMGRATLGGQVEAATLVGWALLLCSSILIGIAAAWQQAQIRVALQQVLRRLLLLGVLRSDPERVRALGAGGMMSRAADAEELELAGLSGALGLFAGLVQLISAFWVQAQAPAALVLPFGAALLLTLLLTLLQGRALGRLRRARLALGGLTVEQLLGSRTRQVQQAEAHWHRDEDPLLQEQLLAMRAADRLGVMAGMLPATFRLVGLGMLLPALVSGASPALLAVGVGGVLLGVGALQAVGAALGSLARLWVVGGSFLPYLRAALRPEVVGLPGPTAAGTLELRGGVAGYDPQRPVLREVELHIQPGSRWLVEGESGAGKSTLLRVLAGLMPLQGGQLRYAGWDQAALSRAQWRSLVALTPQSHDNHIFSDSLAFNLLMGRAWPPDPEDLDQAKALCQAVGLGPMLERMPSGLNQLVGEGGWQLSQGEQSRVVLLRALLQDSQVLVLDESFAALDPETLGQCMGALWERPGTLVVVAHP